MLTESANVVTEFVRAATALVSASTTFLRTVIGFVFALGALVVVVMSGIWWPPLP